MPRKEIAIALGISEETVKRHLSSVYRKTGTNAARDAARVLGLLPPLERHDPLRVMTLRGEGSRMAVPPTPAPSSEPRAVADRPDAVREMPTSFEHFPTDRTHNQPEALHASYRPLERAVLTLLIAVLLLTAINYRSTLVEAARDAAVLLRSIYH